MQYQIHHAVLAEVPPPDFHTSNIYRTSTFPAQKLSAPPEGRSLASAPTVNGTQDRHVFSARKRYKNRSSVSFLHTFF